MSLAAQDVPTIVINAPWKGDKFNTFIQAIEQPCAILFDEFEKVYDRDDQEKILTDQKTESTRALENETKDLGSTKDLANKIIKDAGEFGSWLGERAPTAIAPIVGRLDKLVADFNEQQKYFKTPEERQTALNALNQNISNEKINLANEMGAFIADNNTSPMVALKALDILRNNNLINSISPDMLNTIQSRIDELDKTQVVWRRYM